jgi:hypothetical protein
MGSNKICIGIPVYGQVPIGFAHSLAQLTNAGPAGTKIVFKTGDSAITRARNAIAADFLESDCDKLLFIDSDLIFSPRDVEKITSHDLPIVGGCYPLKHEGMLNWCGNPLIGVEAPVESNGLQEVRYIGTGFMCIDRSVFVQMSKLDEVEKYVTDREPRREEFDFFRMGPRKSQDPHLRYLTEDWFFCQRWLDMGGRVFADTHVELGHVGQAVWPLQSQEAGKKVQFPSSHSGKLNEKSTSN